MNDPISPSHIAFQGLADPQAILDAQGAHTPLSEQSVEEILACHRALGSAVSPHLAEGWRPAGVEANKFDYPLTSESLRRFAAHYFLSIGFESLNDHLVEDSDALEAGAPVPTPSAKALAWYEARTLEWGSAEATRVNRITPDLVPHVLALMNEPAEIGGVFGSVALGDLQVRTSFHAARVSWRAPALVGLLKRVPDRLVEIGGGHGRFIRDMALLSPATRLVLTDLPFNMIIALRYLREYFGGDVNRCILPEDGFDPSARINIVAPWRLGEVTEPVDAAANFLSFQHMDAVNLAYYGDHIRRLGVRSLLHVNRTDGRWSHEMGIDDYPFRDGFKSVFREPVWGVGASADAAQHTIDLELLEA